MVKVAKRAATFDATIEQGVDFELLMEYLDDEGNPVDFVAGGHIARLVIAEKFGATAILSYTSTAAEITLNANSSVSFSIPAATSAAWDFDYAVWQFEIENGAGVVTRWWDGQVTLSREI